MTQYIKDSDEPSTVPPTETMSLKRKAQHHQLIAQGRANSDHVVRAESTIMRYVSLYTLHIHQLTSSVQSSHSEADTSEPSSATHDGLQEGHYTTEIASSDRLGHGSEESPPLPKVATPDPPGPHLCSNHTEDATFRSGRPTYC
jgi:hypothetical protein